MRLRAVAPIVLPDEELERRQSRYASLAPAGVEIELANLRHGPDRLESEEQVRASEELVYEEAMRTDWDRYDGVLLDCVLDPALEQLERDAPRPVIGITRLASGYLAGLGHDLGAVARTEAIADELARRIEAFGHGSALVGVTVLSLSLEDIARPERWNAVLAETTSRPPLASVGSVINGCSAVEVHPAAGPAVVDPTALALDLVGIAVGRGLLGS
ncbi:MAG: aspartate/glutamate racemase family protein [Gaiellales bacterium]